MGKIHSAAEAGNTNKVLELLSENPELLESIYDEVLPDRPLHLAVAQGRLKIINILLDAGADINARGDIGWTPLHHASWQSQKRAAELLINRGADLNIKDDQNCTPLFLAARNKNAPPFTIAKMLLSAGAKSDLNVAICMGDLEKVREYFRTGKTALALSPFPGACVYDAIIYICCQIEQACWKDCSEEELEEIFLKYRDLVELPLAHGADVDGLELSGAPALFHAVQLRTLIVAKYLLEHGANPQFKLDDGSTLKQFAKNSKKKKEMMKLLESFGG